MFMCAGALWERQYEEEEEECCAISQLGVLFLCPSGCRRSLGEEREGNQAGVLKLATWARDRDLLSFYLLGDSRGKGTKEEKTRQSLHRQRKCAPGHLSHHA